MSESGSGGYLKGLLIFFFALSIVFIGASELQKKHRRAVAKDSATRKEASVVMRGIQGNDIRASISRQAVKDISSENPASGGAARKEKLSGGFWSRFVSGVKSQKRAETAVDDQLDGSDRRQLNDLLGKVSR